ncbi:AI-2E family transporter [Nonomuraea typhae]|uniref:AI-2E family transporter n=1 Tax=Nonomuraea typhae TaxID=2603600 RepID=UPI0012F9686A|nr:AI-2E family transporter [Nonomuraea typhae]
MMSRGLRVLIGTAAAVVALAGIREVSEIAGPAFLALTLTIAVSPLRSWLVRRGAPGWVTVFVPLATVVVVLGALALALVVAVAQLAELVPAYAGRFQELLASVTAALERIGITAGQAKQIFSTLDPGKLVKAAGDILSSLLGVVSAAVLIVLLLFGMSLDAGFLQEAIRRLTPAPVASALAGFAKDTCNYLVVSTVFGLIVAVLDAAALAILGVPLPLLWGLLAFITNYIPNVGFVIGLVPPALLALLASGPATMVWVVVVYCVLNFVIQSVIQPKYTGASAGLSTTLTMLSLLVWAYVLGALGAILAVPLSAFVRAVLVDADPATRWASPLVAGREVTPRP